MTNLNDTLKQYVDQICAMKWMQEFLDVEALREGFYVLINNGLLDENQIFEIRQQLIDV